MKKITVIGDIMVEPPFMQQVMKDGKCDFLPSFLPLKPMLDEADYVIANLETPLAGEEAGYTSRIVSFNAPDSLAEALAELGVDAVSTSNNHCLDRGYDGLARTLEVLDRYGIAHTGTYPENHTGDRIHYFNLGDTKCALIAYTASTNSGINGVHLSENQQGCVNMLRPQVGAPRQRLPLPQSYDDTVKFCEEVAGRKLIWEETVKLMIAMHIPVPYADEVLDEQEQDLFFRNVEKDYREARENADLVFFYPHSGGQFNDWVGAYTKRLVHKCAELGFDAVFAAHSHTSQLAEFVDDKPCFYSMGNVTMSPGTFYSVPECLPEYGLAAHLYIDADRIQKVTFSIFKMVEENGEAMRVVPVDVLCGELTGEKKAKLIADNATIYARVTGTPIADILPQKEYDLA